MPITDILVRNAELYAGEIALVEINPNNTDEKPHNWKEDGLVEASLSKYYRNEITWKEFDEKANRFANSLLKLGYKKGDKIAILLMNCLEWLPVYFGVLKMGGLAVPFNFRYASDEIKYCLDLSDASFLIFGEEFTERVEAIKDNIPAVKNIVFCGSDCPVFAQDYYKLVSDAGSQPPDIKLTDDDEAAIYFSSGTTGFPKAILHPHKSLMYACITENKHHSQTHDDIFLCIPPLYHTGAKMHWFGSFLVGGRGVILKGIKPEWIIETVHKEKCTVVWLLVPWAQDILDAIESGKIELSKYELSQWRLMHMGAQPIPPSLVKRWQTHFPQHQYDTNYGLSESTGPGCVHLGVENIDKVGAIGIPGFSWEVMIADENGNAVKDGEVGELYIKGPAVMRCYYKDEKATAATLKNGWLLTGDMAKRDSDGFIFLVDRKKDVIITGGENIYPVQIEDFLRTNPAIKDVAVIGLPEKRLGEITAAIIELKEGFENIKEEDINNFCNALPRYKRPKKIIFDKVPRNPTGKIEKPKLRAKYCSETLVEAQLKN